MNIMELAKEYILYHDLRESSQSIYISSANKFVGKFGHCDLKTVGHKDVLLWRKELIDGGLSKRSWNTYSSHLRTLYKYGIEEETLSLTKNPFNKTSVLPPKRKKKTVPVEGIDQGRSKLYLLKDEEEQTGKRSSITPAWFWLIVFETFYFTGIRLNALLNVTLADVNLKQRLIMVRAETEKTHREFFIPIPDGLLPHLHTLVQAARAQCFASTDQLFNVNRFSGHYRSKIMNVDQVESMYKKLITATGIRMTPHRFRHTIASDLMKQPDRNIHVTKTLLNHSNMATTMEYIEPDYEVMRMVMNERALPRDFDYYMQRSGEADGRAGAIASRAAHSLAQSHHHRPKIRIDKTPPAIEQGQPIDLAPSFVARALELHAKNSATHSTPSPQQVIAGQANYPVTQSDEPLTADEMAFIGKFLDWLRFRGVDDGAQLLLDRGSSISEQLQASKGCFEGIAWVNRPGR